MNDSIRCPSCAERRTSSKAFDSAMCAAVVPTNTPTLRYYIGVPLRTKKGIAIGSLFAIDDKVRGPLSKSAKKCTSVC